MKRRQRRQLGKAVPLIPTDDSKIAIKEIISTETKLSEMQRKTPLSVHMANARKELLSPSKIRPITAHPLMRNTYLELKDTKLDDMKISSDGERKSLSVKLNHGLVNSSSTSALNNSEIVSRLLQKDHSDRLKKRMSDVNQKMEALREKTKNDIENITAKCVQSNAESINNLKVDSIEVKSRLSAGGGSPMSPTSQSPSTCHGAIPKEKTRQLESVIDSKIFSHDEKKLHFDDSILIIKETETHQPNDLANYKVIPVLRRKSAEEHSVVGTAPNHIVSILKKKDHADSSSASSNSSPVTFSSSVIDTPTRSAGRQGILKKRSSLDESRYSRSRSPDEKSILVKSNRRNSLEESQHGILKQRSYEIRTDVSSTTEPHGILKKKESQTPSETHSKHVSISQAVILAAAELCHDREFPTSDTEYEIRPILKPDTPELMVNTPKPILKKKYSTETEEIRPILKTSRKSSREESDTDTDSVRPILKVDSPAKRRSYHDPFEHNLVMERSRSLENQETLSNSNSTANMPIIEKPIVSVAERVRSMEQVLGGSLECSSSSSSLSAKRDLYKNRFKTQPVTVDELSRSV